MDSAYETEFNPNLKYKLVEGSPINHTSCRAQYRCIVMKWLSLFSIAVSSVFAAVPGFDISHYQASVNFAAAYNPGARFVIIKVLPQSHSEFFHANPQSGH